MASGPGRTIDPRALAPEPFDAFDLVLTALPGTALRRPLELARRRIDMLLGGAADSLPTVAEIDARDLEALRAWPTSLRYDAVDRAVLEVTEQLVIDVAGTTDELRLRCLGELGDQAFTVVQSIYVLDHGLRVRAALRQLFGDHGGAVQRASSTDLDLWTALEQWMKAVARLRSLDPLTTELVRLRGARAHNCRLCRSLRNVQAVRNGADESTFDQIDDYEHSELSERHKVALRLTDAMLWTPTAFPDQLVEQVHEQLSPAESLEVVLDVARNAANKIAVVFGADAANVNYGVELYDIDEHGTFVYGIDLDPPVER